MKIGFVKLDMLHGSIIFLSYALFIAYKTTWIRRQNQVQVSISEYKSNLNLVTLRFHYGTLEIPMEFKSNPNLLF